MESLKRMRGVGIFHITPPAVPVLPRNVIFACVNPSKAHKLRYISYYATNHAIDTYVFVLLCDLIRASAGSTLVRRESPIIGIHELWRGNSSVHGKYYLSLGTTIVTRHYAVELRCLNLTDITSFERDSY